MEYNVLHGEGNRPLTVDNTGYHMNLESAESLATSLIATHLGTEWSFSWNRRKSSFGLCNYSTKTIQLSHVLMQHEDIDSVRSTILHEIAHAMTPGHKHDAVWRGVASRLGVKNPSSGKKASQPDKIEYKWALTYKGEIVRKYHRKPNATTLRNLPYMSLRGKPESKGKLMLERVR